MNSTRKILLRSTAAFLLGAATIVPIAGIARADSQTEVDGPSIVANGGFERGADPGVKLAIPAGAPLLENWIPGGAELSVYGTYWQAEEGTRSLALANPGKTITTGAAVTQTLTTKVGQPYRVIFYQAGNPNDHQPSTVRITIGGYTHDYTYQSNPKATVKAMDWVQRSFIYTATATSTPLSFAAVYSPGNDPFGLDNVQVRPILPAAGTPATTPGAATTVQAGSATVAAGAKQTVQVRTATGAALVLVVDYPDGTQVVTQAHAGADGHYSYSWTLPSTVHGTVHVLVDGAGSVAQSTFKVS